MSDETASADARAVMGLINGFWKTQALCTAAKLAVADCIHDAPQTADELALQVGTHPRALFRLLRALASVGVFQCDEAGRWSNTRLSLLLRRDAPNSLRPMALLRSQLQYSIWGHFEDCVRQGRSGFEIAHAQPMFEHLAENHELGSLFDQAMESIHGAESACLIDAYDFSQHGPILDLGGGNGSFLAAVLDRFPSAKGAVADLPAVIERVREKGSLQPFGDRAATIACDFFHSVPSGFATYFMRHIIHDWDDERSLQILRNCRQVMPANGRLLIAEFVIPEGNGAALGKWFDLAMLVGPGGQERTLVEYTQLLEQAGFTNVRQILTPGEICLLQAQPASIS